MYVIGEWSVCRVLGSMPQGTAIRVTIGTVLVPELTPSGDQMGLGVIGE